MKYSAPHIPFDALDQFYFGEFIPSLHPSLRHCLTDERILHHDPNGTIITSVSECMPAPEYQYSCLPWVMNDVLELPDDLLLNVGQVHLLDFIHNILTDGLFDNQLPDPHLVIITLNQIQVYVQQQFRSWFPASDSFWEVYDQTYRVNWDAFAAEYAFVVAQSAPFLLEDYIRVSQGKAAITRRTIMAMGKLGGKSETSNHLVTAYESLWLADLLIDDATDWREDATNGRRTLPMVLALQMSNIPVEQFAAMTLQELELAVQQTRVIPGMMDGAITHLDEAITKLTEVDMGASKCCSVLRLRREEANRLRGAFNVQRTLNMFLERL